MGYQTGYKSILTSKLTSGATSMVVATAPTVTSGRLLLKKGNIKEWISFTGVSGSTLTGLTRGLSQTADPATAGIGLEWPAGSQVILVAMHDQLPDRQDTSTFKDINFSGTTTGGLKVKNLTTVQRGALTASNGMIVYDTDLGELYQYIGGAWSTISAGSTQPNASTTVAGKIEIATDVEVTAGTGTGGTGAVLSVTPTQANKLVTLATTDTTSDETDYYIFGDAAASNVNKKILKSDLRNDLAASTTLKGTVELATDAEATAGTDETRYINSKQAKDNYGFGVTMTTATASTGTSDAYTSSTLVTGNGFACMTFTWSTGNAPSSVSVGIQTSPDNSTWTTKISQTFTRSNVAGEGSLSLLIPSGYYVRGLAGGNSDDHTSVILNIQQ